VLKNIDVVASSSLYLIEECRKSYQVGCKWYSSSILQEMDQDWRKQGVAINVLMSRFTRAKNYDKISLQKLWLFICVLLCWRNNLYRRSLFSLFLLENMNIKASSSLYLIGECLKSYQIGCK